MIVCVCTGLSDRHVRALAQRGARRVEDVSRACGAATCCGACHNAIDAVLRDACEAPPKSAVSKITKAAPTEVAAAHAFAPA